MADDAERAADVKMLAEAKQAFIELCSEDQNRLQKCVDWMWVEMDDTTNCPLWADRLYNAMPWVERVTSIKKKA